MKTPQEIAADIYWTATDATTGPAIRALIVAGIEADRAQRQAEIYIVQNEQGEVMDVFRDADEATAVFQDGYTVIEERVSEPGEMAEGIIGMLTREWEDATGDRASDYGYLSEDDWAFGLNTDDAAMIARLIEWKEQS